jgi:hypothetical protein
MSISVGPADQGRVIRQIPHTRYGSNPYSTKRSSDPEPRSVRIQRRFASRDPAFRLMAQTRGAAPLTGKEYFFASSSFPQWRYSNCPMPRFYWIYLLFRAVAKCSPRQPRVENQTTSWKYMRHRALFAIHPHFKFRPLYYLYSGLYEDARYPYHYRLPLRISRAVTGRNGLMNAPILGEACKPMRRRITMPRICLVQHCNTQSATRTLD